MADTARIRWVLLCVALAGTLVASIYPPDGDEAVEAVEARPARPRLQPGNAAAAAVATPAEPDWVAGEADPFAPRGWQAAPPAPEPARTVQAVQAEDAPPPPPPPLPYAFVGQMSDGESNVVYLNRGEQLLVARAGDVLESTYKVVLIDKSHIEFETVASGLRQTLAIPAQDR